MNCNRFIRGVAMLCACSLLWVSCQKEKADFTNVPSDNRNQIKPTGFIPDDPAVIGKIAKVTSTNFLADNISDYFLFQPQHADAKAAGNAGRDRTSPNVNIINPLTGSTVSDIVTVQVSASDNVAVTSVVLKVDGNIIGSIATAPYNFTWSTQGLGAGTHTLSATATDAAGNIKTSSIQVGYQTPAGTDITPPTVGITSPINGASVSAGITVQVSASDNIGVATVTLSVDGAMIGTDNSSPYSLSWNTATVATGIHTLMAVATDAAGNVNSNSIQVVVNTTTLPPATLPSSVHLIMPPVGLQGGEFSCVAWAVSNTRSAEKYYKTNATTYDASSNIFSPEYIYNQAKFGSECSAGTGVSTCLNILKNQGVCTWQSMPYTSTECSTLPNSSQTAEAMNFKIGSYAVVYQNDEVALKTLLSQNHPLIAGTSIDNNFTYAGPGFIWNNFNSSYGTNHAFILCGYDDAKHAYKIMNSWGTSWGDAGYSWVDYDFFGTLPGSVYVIQNPM